MQSPGVLLTSDRDLLDGILAMLTGTEASRIASTCRAFAQALSPHESHLWRSYYSNEYARLELEPSGSDSSWKNQYRAAHQRLGLLRARWYSRTPSSLHTIAGDVEARQGAASSVFKLAGQGCFCVYGGWSDYGIQRDLHVLRRRPASGEGLGTWQWSRLDIAEGLSRGPRRTYGHTLTAIVDADGQAAQLLVHGGVTSGGYRGAIGALHTIRVSLADEPSGRVADDDGLPEEELPELPELSAAWVGGGGVDGRPRAYHTATLLPAGSAAHPSNQQRLWVFGGFNDFGRLASLDVFDTISGTWEALAPDGREPCARIGHTCVEAGGRLYVCGGCTDTSNMKPGEGGLELGDICELDTRLPTGELAWTTVGLPTAAPPGALQRCHGVARLGDRLLFFGGGRSMRLSHQ